MFGQNEPKGQDVHHWGTTLDVVDVFPTIQGEGPLTGRRAAFIRLAHCNLRCSYCDTEFTKGAHLLTVAKIVDSVKSMGCELAVITGGEPLRQNLEPLISVLLLRGAVQHVQVETSGSLPYLDQGGLRPWADQGLLTTVVSPKTPKLAGVFATWPGVYYKYVLHADEVCRDDGLPDRNPQGRGQTKPVARPPAGVRKWCIYVQPMDVQTAEGNARNLAACVEAASRYGYTLSIQLHKLIGVP